MPVLMINDRYDQTLPLDLKQKPLFNLLGTDAASKKQLIYDAGQVGYPVSEL